MSKQIIHTDDAPAAVGTYSQAVKVGDTVYISGQLGLDPKTMTLKEGFKAQAEQAMIIYKPLPRQQGAACLMRSNSMSL